MSAVNDHPQATVRPGLSVTASGIGQVTRGGRRTLDRVAEMLRRRRYG